MSVEKVFQWPDMERTRSQSWVALVEWNWAGHHPTYFAHFVLALEELGIKVLAICPDPKNVRQEVLKLRKILLKKAVLAGHTEYREYIKPAGRRTLPARLGTLQRAIYLFRSIEHSVKSWQRESGNLAGSLFYSCIYDSDFEWHCAARPFLTLPWRGLYLHAASFRRPGKPLLQTGRLPCPERIFRGRLFRGVGILDEGIAGRVETMVKRPVAVFPDLTDETMPSAGHEPLLARRLKQFAQNRPIAGLFGHLQKSKGLLPFLRASQHKNMAQICFALGGEIIWHTFSEEEAQSIQHILANAANVWSHIIRIPDGPDLNSLLAACDLLYTGYLDFPHSSNMLTKAAFLKKPLIVSDGHLMAERVRRFNLGEVIPPGEVNASMEAILKITSNTTDWIQIKQPRWADYCAEHSFTRLVEVFRGLLAKP